jgi:hypothetical protein
MSPIALRESNEPVERSLLHRSYLAVDALASVSGLTLSVVQKLSRFLQALRFYAPLLNPRDV